MLNIKQFKSLIIAPALKAIDLYSEAAEELILGTAIQESKLTALKQYGNGPALGLFQMEPATHEDIWNHYLRNRRELAFKASGLLIVDFHMDIVDQLTGNLWYAAAMCRIHYRRRPEALPPVGNTRAQADYWKMFYNTMSGKGTVEQYINSWNEAHA